MKDDNFEALKELMERDPVEFYRLSLLRLVIDEQRYWRARLKPRESAESIKERYKNWKIGLRR